MINVNIRTKEGTTQHTIPSSWDEITLEQFLIIETKWNRDDVVHLFSILSGVEYSDVDRSTDENLEALIYEVVQFVYKSQDWKNLNRPTHLQIGHKLCKVPEDLGEMALGQKVLLNQAIERANSTSDMLLDSLAICFQPVYDGGRFERKRLDRIKELLLKSKALDAYAIATFFLTNPNVWPRFGALGFQARRHRKKTPSPS